MVYLLCKDMVHDTVQDTHDRSLEQFSFDDRDVDKVFRRPHNLQDGGKSSGSGECHTEVADHKLDHNLYYSTSKADFSRLPCHTCMAFEPNTDI